MLRVSGLLPITLLLGACASVGFGDRPGVDQLTAEMERCRSQASAAPGALQACVSKSKGELAALAQSALANAQSQGNRANKVALLALAAQAGWESEDPAGLAAADAAAQAGTIECGRFGAGEFRPARDCALLAVAPGFVFHVRTVTMINRLRPPPRTALSAEDKQLVSETSRGYVASTFEFVESRRRDFEADPELPPALIESLSRQRTTFYCTAGQLPALARRAGDPDAARVVVRGQVRMRNAVPALTNQTCSRRVV